MYTNILILIVSIHLDVDYLSVHFDVDDYIHRS